MLLRRIAISRNVINHFKKPPCSSSSNNSYSSHFNFSTSILNRDEQQPSTSTPTSSSTSTSISDLSSVIEKPKRTRRSKAEVESLRAQGLLPPSQKDKKALGLPRKKRSDAGVKKGSPVGPQKQGSDAGIKKASSKEGERKRRLARRKEAEPQDFDPALFKEKGKTFVQKERELKKLYAQTPLSQLPIDVVRKFQWELGKNEEAYQEEFKQLEKGFRTSIEPPEGPPPVEVEELADWLPHPYCWKYTFNQGMRTSFLSSHRYFLQSRKKAKDIVESLKLEGDGTGKKWTVLEAYPGPGVLTREFLDSSHVEKVIAMEEIAMFKPWLQSLKSNPLLCPPTNPDRLELIANTGYYWETYDQVIEGGHLDHLSDGRIKRRDGSPLDLKETFSNSKEEGAEFDSESPILFVAQLPNTVHSEQLYAQLIHAASSRTWLFRYGRVRMVFVAGEHLAIRSIAAPGQKTFRGKLSCAVQALTDLRVLEPSSSLTPHHASFYPPHPSVGLRLPFTNPEIPTEVVAGPDSRYPMSVIEILPKKEQDQAIHHRDLMVYEYITRNLFVLKTKSVEEALTHVSPGAHNILKKLAPGDPSVFQRGEVPVDPKTRVVDLEVSQLASLARVFEKWPFRPKNLFEQGRLRGDQRGKKHVTPF